MYCSIIFMSSGKSVFTTSSYTIKIFKVNSDFGQWGTYKVTVH